MIIYKTISPIFYFEDRLEYSDWPDYKVSLGLKVHLTRFYEIYSLMKYEIKKEV